MSISRFGKKVRLESIQRIKDRLELSKINLKELGNDRISRSREETSYRDLRPYNCDCAGLLTPEEEMEWHVHHIGTCLKNYKEINDFEKRLRSFIIKEGKRFKKEKEQAWERIFQKSCWIDFDDRFGKHLIMDCRDKEELKEKEERHERIINKFNDYKNQVIREIIQKAKNQGISETELNNTRPNWQNTLLLSLTNRKKITDYQNLLEKVIQNLVAAKKKSGSERQQAEKEAKENAQKEEARSKKEREEQEKKEAEERDQKEKKGAAEEEKKEKEQAKQQELNQKRDKVISEIITALNQEPQLMNGELSPEYQNWEGQINQITDIQQITNFQDRLLADIQARRQDKKTAQEVKENLNKVKTGTKEQKEQAWKDLEKSETEKVYQENKAEVENLKKEQATENPQKYSQEAKQRIENKLKNNQVKENELNQEDQQEWKKLKSGQIQDPQKLVEIETKITQSIYQKGVEKKVIDLTSRVNQILKSKSNPKSQIAALKKELLTFISSSNIYYSAQKKAVENLLTQLENHSTTNHNQNTSKPKNSPWKTVIPFLLGGLILMVIMVILSRRKNSRRKISRK